VTVQLRTRRTEGGRDGANHLQTLRHRKIRMQVNLPSPIWQVQVPIQRVITPIRGLPNRIRQVVRVISTICLYPPHRSHISLSLPQLYHHYRKKVKPSLFICPCHDHELTPSTAYTMYSIHELQHTPSTASTQDCLFSIHSHDHQLTPECSFSFRHASLYQRLPSASFPSELNCKVTLSHSHHCEQTK